MVAAPAFAQNVQLGAPSVAQNVQLGAPSVAQNVQLGAPSVAPGEPVTVAPGDAVRGLGGFGETIDAAPLDALSAEAGGLARASALGLSRDMWADTGADTALALVRASAPGPLRSVNDLIRRALVAGSTPPEGAEGLLAARAAALLRMGAAEEAASLAGIGETATNQAIGRASAEAALTVGREEALCGPEVMSPPDAMALDPFWSGLRGYCLARSGDPLAAVAIGAMRELGNLDSVDASMLEAMVDESLSDYVVIPAPDQLSALRIALLRGLGKSPSVAAATAPLSAAAGLFALESTNARAALIAAERLEAAAAIPTQTLIDLYEAHAGSTEGTPVGERAKLVRDTLKSPNPKNLGDGLFNASRTYGAGAFAALGRALGPAAARSNPAAARGMGAGAYLLRDAMLLSGAVREAGIWSDAQGPRAPADQADAAALMAVADPDWPGNWSRSLGDALRERAGDGDEHARRALGALAALEIAPRPKLPEEGMLAAAAEGRVAETVFAAAAALNAEPAPSARTLDTAMRALRRIGLEQDARRIAIEAMLTARWR